MTHLNTDSCHNLCSLKKGADLVVRRLLGAKCANQAGGASDVSHLDYRGGGELLRGKNCS